jgi:type IV secretory pathway VirB10-like protein
MRGSWEESDEVHRKSPQGKVRKNLHWFVAGGLGLSVIVGFGLQSSLTARADASGSSHSTSSNNPLVLGNEPPLVGLNRELARQEVDEPAPLASPRLPVPETPAEDEAQRIRRLETEKRDALVASSRMLAINRGAVPASAQPVAAPTISPTQATVAAVPSLNEIPAPFAPAAGVLPDRGPSGNTLSSNSAAAMLVNRSRPQHDMKPLIPSQPASDRMVLEGTLIPAVLLTQISSDLPGMLTAQVAEDIYDSIRGNFLAIPKGSRLIGEYGSRVVTGQERIMASFHRLILPGGTSFNLDAMQAADAGGQSGMKDEVDTRFWKRLGGQFMTAGLARVIAEPQGGVTILGGAGNTLTGDAAGQILVDTARVGFQANAMLGPVIVIKRGYPFVIMVNQDMDFSALASR